MNVLQLYHDHILPRLEKGMVDHAEIAESITADATRYPSAEFTLEQVALALAGSLVPDPSEVVTRLVNSLKDYVASSGDVLVKHKLDRVLDTYNPGTIDLGNFLQRHLLLTLAANTELAIHESDVAALLSLVEVPAMVTSQEVADAIQARADRDAEEAASRAFAEGLDSLRKIYDETYNAEVTSLWVSETVPTKEELALALESQAVAVRNS